MWECERQGAEKSELNKKFLFLILKMGPCGKNRLHVLEIVLVPILDLCPICLKKIEAQCETLIFITFFVKLHYFDQFKSDLPRF